jgi:hypothetical protein
MGGLWLIHTCTLSLLHLAGGTLASSSRDRALRMLCMTFRGSPVQKEFLSGVAWRGEAKTSEYMNREGAEKARTHLQLWPPC